MKGENNKLEEKTITLNNGYKIPILGLGTWQLTGKIAEEVVYNAIKNGYRLIDTALIYENEENVGNAIKKAIQDGIVKRDELFITTKLLASGISNYEKAIEDCNNRLGVEYIDLMLIHQQGEDEQQLCRAIECKVKEGIIKSFGISNYYDKKDFNRIINYSNILPAIIQNENHIFFNNIEFKNYVSEYGVVVQSYYPFGGRGHLKDSLTNNTITEIAKKYKKTSAQIILRWHMQSGYISVFGCSQESHLLENKDIFNFELTKKEMQEINILNIGKRYEKW